MDPIVFIPVITVSLLMVFVLPLWPWSRGWGYTPAGVLAVTLGTVVLFLVAALAERAG